MLPTVILQMLRGLSAELRGAIRSGRRAAASSALAVLTLGLAIGSSTAIYSTLEEVVLDPLPFEDSDRLVVLWRRSEGANARFLVNPSREQLEHWRENATSFERIEGFAVEEVTADDPSGARTWTALRVSPGFLDLVGRSPALGRMFAADEVRDRPALLSWARWRRDHGGSTDVIGRTLALDGELHTIVGVLPPRFPAPVGSPDPVDVLLPVVDPERSRHGLGRLAAGVTVEQAKQELDALIAQLDDGDDGGEEWSAAVLRPADLLGSLRERLWTLMAGVAVVLLIACSNVGSLLIARFAGRRRELAVRSALGASRRRLALQLFLESVLLASVAGALGLVLAGGGVALIRRLRPEGMEALEQARVSGAALGFTVGAAVLAALAAGLAPAVRAARGLRASDLRAGLAATVDRGQGRLRSALVVGQVGLSFLLVVGGVLLVERVRQLGAVDLGFQAERLARAQIRLPAHSFGSEESRRAYWEGARSAGSALAGAERVALALGLPPASAITFGTLEVEGVELPEQPPGVVWFNQIDDDYLRAAGIPTVAGALAPGALAPRAADTEVCLVNEAFARRIWGRADAVGERLRIGGGEWQTVIGVVGDVRVTGPASDLEAPQLYVPNPLTFDHGVLVVRADDDPSRLVGPLRDALRELDPRALVESVDTVDALMWRRLAEERFTLALLGLFSAGALFLAVVGLYSVVAQSVEQRRKELALRLALGASAGSLRRRIAGSGAALAGLGLALGFGLVLAAWRLASGAVFGEAAPGARIHLLAALVVVVAVAAALVRPAHRAGSVEPITALREE